MKFEEYVSHLKTILENNPELKNLEVVYAADDEGNHFNSIWYAPSLGNFNGEYNGEFIYEDDFSEEVEVNAICVN